MREWLKEGLFYGRRVRPSGNTRLEKTRVFDLGLMSKSPKDSVEELRSSSVSIPMTFDKREFFQTPSAACLKRCGILLLQVEEPFRFFSYLKSEDLRHSDDMSDVGDGGLNVGGILRPGAPHLPKIAGRSPAPAIAEEYLKKTDRYTE